MADIDELYTDVFQIPLTSVKRTPVKRKSCLGSAAMKSIDENSVDIYSDMSLDGSSPYKMTPTESNCRQMCEDQSLNGNLDLYTEVMTSELTEKSNQELDRLRSENKKLLAENKKLQSLKDQLNKNISSLFLTAKKELQEKDEEIRTLRKLVEEQRVSSIDKIRGDVKLSSQNSSHKDDTLDQTRNTHKSEDRDVKSSFQNSSHKDDTLDIRKPNCSEKAKDEREKVGSTRDSVVGSTRESVVGSARESVVGSTRDSVANVKLSSLSTAVPPTSLKSLPASDRKLSFESKGWTSHTEKTLPVTDLRNKLLSRQRDTGVKENKLKHEKSKTIDEEQINTQSSTSSHKQNDKTLTSNSKTHIEGKEKTPNKPIILKSAKVVEESYTQSIDSPTLVPDSRCVSEKNSEFQQPHLNLKHSEIITDGIGAVNDETFMDIGLENNKSWPPNQYESVQTIHKKKRQGNRDECLLNSEMCKDPNTDLRQFLKSRVVNDEKLEVRIRDKAEPAQNLTNRVETTKKTVDNCVVQEKRKNQDVEAEVNKTGIETPPLKKNKVTESVEPSQGVLNKVVSYATSKKVDSEPVKKVESKTANNLTPETAKKVVPRTAKKVISETAKKIVSETAKKVESETAKKDVPENAKKVVSQTAKIVLSNVTSIDTVWRKKLKGNVSEKGNKETSNKADSSQNLKKVVSVQNKIDEMNTIFNNKINVLNAPNKAASTEDCNKIGSINETSNSSFTNHTWPFQVTSNFHFENSKDASNDVGDTKSKTDRAFPIEQVTTVLPVSPGHQNLSSSFVDIEDVDSEEETDWNDNGNQNRTLTSLGDVTKIVCTQSGTVPSDNLIFSNGTQPCQQGGSCSEDSQSESPSPLPFSTFVTGKAKVKSDDSNDSEKASSNSSATYTDSDKLSLSSEEFPKTKETRPLESPVPFATSITCASNLILLGDEETTCTTFVSPCKPPYLPSEFYPPGARAPVQVETSYARHIRGPPEVIQKPRARLTHKESCTSDATKSQGFPSRLDFPSKDSDSLDLLKEQLVEDTRKLQKIKADCNPKAKKHLEYLTKNTVTSWTCLVEQKFYEVFHKELKTFKEGNGIMSQAGSGRLDERRKCRLLEKKRDWIRRGREQGHVSNSVGNSSVLSNAAHDKTSASSNSVSKYHNTVNQTVQEVNQTVQEAETLTKDIKTVSSKTGDETSENGHPNNGLQLVGQANVGPHLVGQANIGPHLVGQANIGPLSVGQARNSPDSWMVSSSDYQNNVKNLSGKPDTVERLVSTEEPDSTCEYQNISIQGTREVDLLSENHQVLDYEENSSDIHLYLSAEDTAEENESNKSSPAVSHYKASRHIKTSSPRHSGEENVLESRLRTETVLNTTFTVSESNSDSNHGEVGNDGTNPTDAKKFGRLVPPEEISLMEASLSEFDVDVRNTPSRQRKPLLVESSPLSFRNKINLKNISNSPKFVVSPFKSQREITKTMECIRTKETSKTVDTEAHSIIPVTTNICQDSETIVCSRHRTFQDLKGNKCVKSQYVFVLSSSDESGEDSLGCDNQTAGTTPAESTRVGQMNEEEREFIWTVQRVKKKLDLDSAASMCGSVNQSPVIHVSDSLTSPPYRRQASEPIDSGKKLTKDSTITLIPNSVNCPQNAEHGKKLTKESAITQMTDSANCTQTADQGKKQTKESTITQMTDSANCTKKADHEDVEEGELLESSLETTMHKNDGKDKNCNKVDSHKEGDRKYCQVTEERKAVSKERQGFNSTKTGGTNLIKIRNEGSRNGQVSKSEIPFDKSSRIDCRLVGNQLSSSSKHSKPTPERINESNRIRKRSRSPREPVREHKYRRHESGQRLALKKSDKGPRQERDKRRDERRSREYQEADRDLQYRQERRKYSDWDRDRKYTTPREAYHDKHRSKENKHRSSSRYE